MGVKRYILNKCLNMVLYCSYQMKHNIPVYMLPCPIIIINYKINIKYYTQSVHWYTYLPRYFKQLVKHVIVHHSIYEKFINCHFYFKTTNIRLFVTWSEHVKYLYPEDCHIFTIFDIFKILKNYFMALSNHLHCYYYRMQGHQKHCKRLVV